jgi:alkanesulfonate monooxygenase SsuD/methylene tetrahydromethanopterin reductase-like flavin-dependent oxidoreductase (luciferase family)
MGLSNAERRRRFIEKLKRAAKAGGDASHWQPEIATLRDALVGSQKELAQALTQLHQAKALIAELEAARPASRLRRESDRPWSTCCRWLRRSRA